MPLLYVFYATIVSLLWGANFVAAKIAMEHFPPLLLLALRFAAVAAMLLPFYHKRTLRLKFVLSMSVVLGTVHFGLVFGGIYHGIDIPTAIIATQLGVPFSCLLSAMLFEDRLGPWRSFGLMIAFLGMMLIAGTPNVVEHFGAFVMVMSGAFCWAVSNIMMKKEKSVNIMELLAWMSLFTAPQLLLVSLLVESNQWELVATVPLSAVLGIGFSAVFSTVVAYGLWYHLLKNYDVSRVTPFNLLVPFFGIGIGQLFYNDPLTPQILIGGAITIAGVGIIVVRQPKLAAFMRIRKGRAV